MAFASKDRENEYVNEYKKEKYDRITLLVPKGEKERYKEMAKNSGMSLSEFFVSCANDRVR